MHVLWVLAHPDERSLNGALHRAGLDALAEAGHTVEVSDLYAMKWNPVVDREDYGVECERLHVGPASGQAYAEGTLHPEVVAEQDKLRRADLVVLQFPMWWFGLPAILKGWVDRVFVKGFAYSVPDPARPGRSRKYGDGGLAGKRALAVVTIGNNEVSFSARGMEGALDEVLFPLLHGTFFYTGMAPLRPFAVYEANHLTGEQYRAAAAALRERIAAAGTEEPIPYRTQDSGDYDEDMVLRPEVEPGRTGLDVHIAG